ncbi:prepilin-type N-terminal cleavage/methylation domain-containing protein, partial [Escherichia coli]|uniref:prepilin-type N-terminal cleavage/methylation domain-containing protein n=1 Tax=Escherichia coli TaxID=562 RepID=UPI00207B9142
MKRGFTLLEVMPALAIFALAAIAVLQTASGPLSNQHVLDGKTVPGWVWSYPTATALPITPGEQVGGAQGGRVDGGERCGAGSAKAGRGGGGRGGGGG